MKKPKRPAARKAASKKRKPVMRHGREGVRRTPKRAAGASAERTPPSALKRQYLDAYKREFPTTLKVMKAYPPGKDDFKPHERSSSAVRLSHTFTIENGGAIQAIHGEFKMPPSFPPPPATVAEAAASYEQGARALIEAVEKMPESRLLETVTFFTGPGQTARIPVIDVLWFMLTDSIHHRGQLSVYVRMAGGKVPSIYGPSADEPWR
jgi:uncharacterized damage-inducible protein DinB